MEIVKELVKHKRITPPTWLADCVQYETSMGSVAYGVSSDKSDADIYGFCIPPKEIVFPHLNGEIFGFGKQVKRFRNFQQHHIEHNAISYDLDIYNIVDYFQLVMDNNPNMIDSLFTPERCVRSITPIGKIVRENRKVFLHKGSFHRYSGYAWQQISKMQSKEAVGKRKELVDKFGYDVKYGYHVARLLDESEQILETGDINLERSKSFMKAIRSGAVTQEELISWAKKKIESNTELYNKSSLPHSPDEAKIKQILLNCLEEYYGRSYL